jgi:hypothetical protein
MSTEEVAPLGNLDVGDELCTGSRHEALSRMIFGLALALASDPSKLGQVRQMLVHLQEQRGIALDFATWALVGTRLLLLQCGPVTSGGKP